MNTLDNVSSGIEILPSQGPFVVAFNGITKSQIKNFLLSCKDEFAESDYEYLSATEITKWKFVAKHEIDSITMNKNDGKKVELFDLNVVAKTLIELKDTIDEKYEAFLNDIKIAKQKFEFGVVNFKNINNGVVRYEEKAGVIIDGWLYDKDKNFCHGKISRTQLKSNKIEQLWKYDNYHDLIKKHEKYRGFEKTFDDILIAKGLLSKNK